MEFKQLNGLKLPILGLGTWGIGGKVERDLTSDKDNVETLKKAFQLGYTLIDTAELYARGHSEELLGEAINNLDRKKLFIVSKVSPANLTYEDVISACKKSLKRLQTNYIDLYLIHFPNPILSLKETMEALDYLVEKKLIKYIGVSNFSVKLLKQAQEYTKNKIIVNQIEYNLLVRDNGQFTKNVESEIIPYCQENDIFIMAFRPLAQGRLTGNYKLLDEISKKYNKTNVQIALNWLISKENIVTIPKSINLEHMKENLEAIGWKLKEEDIFKLDKEFLQTVNI